MSVFLVLLEITLKFIELSVKNQEKAEKTSRY